MIEVIQTPELTISTAETSIHVTFVLDGVTYDYDVPFVDIVEGKNRYILNGDLFNIVIDWGSGSYWNLHIDDLTNSTVVNYTNTTDSTYPIFDTWTFADGDFELDSLVTTDGYTSKWSAVHHPIKWGIQRKDRIVDNKSIDGAGFVSLELTELPPTELQVGNMATYYLPNGDKIGSVQVLAISGYRIRLQSLIPGTVTGGFVIFDDLYKNYYVETSVLSPTEIGTIRTIPLSDGSAVVDVQTWLKSKAVQSGKYTLKFRECYNFTKQPYGDETSEYFWTNSALQVGNNYAPNMYEYVTNNSQPVKWLTVFNKPTKFVGFPLQLSFIWSDNLGAKALRKVVDGVHTLLTNNPKAVNTIEVNDGEQSISIEYGTFSGLPPVFNLEGIAVQEILINNDTDCLINPICVKWLNTLGAYEHWVFSYNQIHTLQTANGGSFEPVTDSVTGQIFDIAKFAQPKMTLGTTVTNQNMIGLQTLLYSTDVSVLIEDVWYSCRVEVGSFKIIATKDTTSDIELTLLLPYKNIQTR